MQQTNEWANETSNSSSNMRLQQQQKLQTTQLTQTTGRRIAQKLLLPLGFCPADPAPKKLQCRPFPLSTPGSPLTFPDTLRVVPDGRFTMQMCAIWVLGQEVLLKEVQIMVGFVII